MRDFLAAAMAEIKAREANWPADVLRQTNHGVDQKHLMARPVFTYGLFAYLWSDFIHDYPATRLAETMANHNYISKEALK